MHEAITIRFKTNLDPMVLAQEFSMGYSKASGKHAQIWELR